MRTDTTPSNSNFVLSHRPFQNHGLSHGSKNPTASEGGVVVGDAGKPVRCYANNSDSLQDHEIRKRNLPQRKSLYFTA